MKSVFLFDFVIIVNCKQSKSYNFINLIFILLYYTNCDKITEYKWKCFFVQILCRVMLMFDIHCHILSCVDDGSGSLNDSIEMAELAARSGTGGIIATPHCNVPGAFENFWSADFDAKVKELNDILLSRNIPITVYPGQEIFAYGGIVERIKNNELITLNNSRYLLVEFDFSVSEREMLKYLQMITAEGYVPIVAHPERYLIFGEIPEIIRNIRSAGALVQLNSSSVTGNFGYYPERAALYFLANQLADFVASDAHSQYSRTPELFRVHEIICENYSYEYADLLLDENPLRVINNKEIR